MFVRRMAGFRRFGTKLSPSYTRILLPPHIEVTNVGYYRSVLCYNERSFRYDKNRLVYFHDGTVPYMISISAMRRLLSRNAYSLKKLVEGKADFETVKNRWIDYRHIIEEAGSVDNTLRYFLRDIDFYDSFKELRPEIQKSVESLLTRGKDYFKTKLGEIEKSLKLVKTLKQQRLWPFEYEKLKKLSYDVVEYELNQRGYLMHLMVEELNSQRKTPLSKDECKLAILKSLRFNDSDTLRAYMTDFVTDFNNLKVYDDILDLNKMSAEMDNALNYGEAQLPKIAAAENEQQAVALLQDVLKRFVAILKPAVSELVRRDESKRFPSPDYLKLYHARYIKNTQDYSKDDHFGLYRIFLSGDYFFPLSSLVVLIYGITCYFSRKIIFKRIEKFEEEHGVLVGNRSRYAFSTEEQFKGEGH